MLAEQVRSTDLTLSLILLPPNDVNHISTLFYVKLDLDYNSLINVTNLFSCTVLTNQIACFTTVII